MSVLELAVRTFAGPGKRVLCPEYSFIVFPLAAKVVGAELDMAPVAADFSVDTEALLQAVRADTSMLLLANPNNPTGAWLTGDKLRALLQQLPGHVIVVIDEAYAEYMEDTPDYSSAITWCQQFSNLVVSRTFSKIHGLAGLRVGYGVASGQVADLMNRVRQPFNNNTPALLAAQAALADLSHTRETLRVNDTGREQWLQAASVMRLDASPAPANFVCLKLPRPGVEVAAELEQRGVLLRPVANYGLPGHIRVSFGLGAGERVRHRRATGRCLPADGY